MTSRLKTVPVGRETDRYFASESITLKALVVPKKERVGARLAASTRAPFIIELVSCNKLFKLRKI